MTKDYLTSFDIIPASILPHSLHKTGAHEWLPVMPTVKSQAFFLFKSSCFSLETILNKIVSLIVWCTLSFTVWLTPLFSEATGPLLQIPIFWLAIRRINGGSCSLDSSTIGRSVNILS
jgi:hypothetical protein